MKSNTPIYELSKTSGYVRCYSPNNKPSWIDVQSKPSWIRSSKPSYTKSEVGLSDVENVKQYSANNPEIIQIFSAPSGGSPISRRTTVSISLVSGVRAKAFIVSGVWVWRSQGGFTCVLATNTSASIFEGTLVIPYLARSEAGTMMINYAQMGLSLHSSGINQLFLSNVVSYTFSKTSISNYDVDAAGAETMAKIYKVFEVI